MPYWTTDIGGYHPLYNNQSTDPAYQELYLRWFEFGVFCPIFRTHGHRPNNELWSYPTIEPTLIAYDNLRYRMMPYIYSLAWRVSSDDYTIQRPLVMDFRSDPNTWDIGDQFMFGPALLVNPVTESKVTERRIYLPSISKDSTPTTWYDFWNGQKIQGGVHLQAAAPLDRIPLYVRAGSILPSAHPNNTLTKNRTAQSNSASTPAPTAPSPSMQDEGDNYNYETGHHATIPITWSQSDNTLTIGARQGTYPGMPTDITFNIVWVKPNHGAGPAEQSPDKTITYNGSQQTIKP